MTYSESLKYEIPSGWNVIRFDEISDNLDSKRVPLSRSVRETRKGVYPYYGATEILDYIDDYLFDGDYLLVAEDGSIEDRNGMLITQLVSGKCWVNNHAHVLKPKTGYSNFLMAQMLKHVPSSKISTGSIQRKITQDNLNGLLMINPPEALRIKYIEIIEPLYRQILSKNEETVRLISIRDWLLPMLMTGQAKVSKKE